MLAGVRPFKPQLRAGGGIEALELAVVVEEVDEAVGDQRGADVGSARVDPGDHLRLVGAVARKRV